MSLHEQVHGIRHDPQRHNQPAMPADPRADQLFTENRVPTDADRAMQLRAPYEVIPQDAYPALRNPHSLVHAGDNTHRLCQPIRFPGRPKTAVPTRGA
jgi:hypothetical protein